MKFIQAIIYRVLFAAFVMSVLAAIGLIGGAHAETLADCDSLHTLPKIRQGTIGKHFMLACVPKDKSKVFEYYYVCLKGEENCDEERIAAQYLTALLSPGTKAAAIDSFKPTWSCDAPPEKYKALCAEHSDIIKAEWATWTKDFKPVPRKFAVKANGAAIDRPAFKLLNGVVLPIAEKNVRAPVGAPCLTDKPTAPATLGDIRAQWVGGPDGVVALCAKIAQ